MIQAGRYRHRVGIQQALAGSPRAWVTIATVWGRVEPVELESVGVLLAVAQVQAKVSHRFFFRVGVTLTVSHRLVLADGRVFEVTHVVDRQERHEELVVWAMQYRTQA